MGTGGSMDETSKSADATDREDPDLDALLRLMARAPAVGRSVAIRPLLPGQALLGGRLRVRRRIGEGGMGVVYEAHDEHRRGSVALKTLTRLDAHGVYRLKQEFRSLADVLHPGLCRLHELFSEGEWFFTMELVEGESFDRWVRPDARLDESRLRAALPQICDAVAAIHAAGKLHRDLKPSNLRVTPRGRVVVLDFGLVADESLGGIGQTVQDDSVSGTPAYMAPEQAAGRAASPSSDGYALGAMLFEALTGARPFEGRRGEMLAAKQREAAPRVHQLCDQAPPDLAALCDALLARDPQDRPDLGALRAALAAPPPLASTARAPDPGRLAPDREVLLGRDPELLLLRAAYQAMCAERAVAMFVAGESGMGKSALVGHFLDGLRAQGHAAVLAGRCYERESVPFKAFDAVVDDLSRYLRKLGREEAGALMPREMFALARIFPALERVDAVAEAPRKDIPDPQELQHRAFAAFGELLGRIRDRRPLVLYVDDLQWTDRDSSVFMEYLFAQPSPTPLLLLASHRSEGAESNALLQRAVRAAQKSPHMELRTLAVGPLPREAAQQLAARALVAAGADAAAAIAEEARGSPFFVGELVRQARHARADARKLTLHEALNRHVQGLDSGAHALLDVLAVAGRPLPVQLALDAAGATHDAIDRLLSERLLRAARGSAGERTLECYHDKVRECVSSALAPAQARIVHGQLAAHMSAHGIVHPEHLALHYHGADAHELAAIHYERAGDASAAALAFDHAARQYEQALGLVEASPRALRAKLASALASAGSSRAAAEMYRAACEGAAPEQALEYRRRAAHLLMTSGYIDEGRVLLGEVLSGIGLSLPRSRRRAMASALLSRARLRVRGLRLSERPSAVPPSAARFGALWTVVQGSLGNDPFLMVEMAARYTRLALDSGERAHAARGLSIEAYLASFDGPRTAPRSEALIAQAQQLVDEGAEPELWGWVQEVCGCTLVHQGRFAEARPVLRRTLEWLATRCTGVPFELACGRGYDLNAANHLGQFAEISATAPALVEDALSRGDMYQASGLTGFSVPGWLAHRGLDYARGLFGEAQHRHQAQAHFQWADYLLLMADLSLALYEGAPERGVELARAQWPALERSQLMRMQIARATMEYYRAGCGLGAALRNRAGPIAPRVRAAVRALTKTRLPYASGWAALLDASLAQLSGDAGRAAERLRAAIARLDASALRMYAAAARRRLGQVIGGDEGDACRAAGTSAMLSEGVVDLDATTAMLTPGFDAV